MCKQEQGESIPRALYSQGEELSHAVLSCLILTLSISQPLLFHINCWFCGHGLWKTVRGGAWTFRQRRGPLNPIMLRFESG